MPLILEPRPLESDLRGRIGEVQRQLRAQAILSGMAAILAFVTLFIAAFVLFDHFTVAPAPFRAICLAGLIVGVVLLVRNRLIRPLAELRNEVALALRVEKQYPGFADALASAVEFDRGRDVLDSHFGSPQLQRATIRYAVQNSIDHDFREIVDYRPLARSVVALAMATVLGIMALPLGDHGLRLLRLTDPYGSHPFPPQTALRIDAPSELIRGEPFVANVTISRRVPERAVLTYELEGATTIEQSYSLGSEGNRISENFTVRLEPNRVPRSFRYQVTANDASSGWHDVAVRVPPELVPVEGRATPQLHLTFPVYTRLPATPLPDGACASQAVLGSTISVVAAANRPITHAEIRYRATDPRDAVSVAGVSLASTDLNSAFGLVAATAATISPVPLAVDGEQRRMNGAFIPTISGTYDLVFTDSSGLSGRRPLDIRVQPDPTPNVMLERPAASADEFELLPTASFNLKGEINDRLFGIKRVAIEFKTRASDPLRQLELVQFHADDKDQRMHWEFEREIPLSAFHHTDGKPLAVGDTLTFSVIAQDFDDVSPDKAPGRSHEIELRIVSTEKLAATTQKLQADLANALRDLQAKQTEASRRVTPVDNQRRATGQLRAEDRAALERAEMDERQIMDRIGQATDGIRGLAKRLQRLLGESNQANGSALERAARIASELDQLNKEVLEDAATKLAQARQETGSVPAAERTQGSLPDAARKQAEAEARLRDLAALADEGLANAALASEAASLAAEQKQLQAQREQLAQKMPAGVDRDKLSLADAQSLQRAQEQQIALAQRAAELTRKLDEAAKAEPANQQLDAAKKAAHGDEAANNEALAAKMNHAADSIGRNRLGEAQRQQEDAGKQLEKIRDALRQTDAPDPQKQLADQEKALNEIDRVTKSQEAIQERAQKAAQLPDEADRKKQLEQLAQEQDKLNNEAKDIARDLNRQGQNEASREMDQAARAMQQSREAMKDGRAGREEQDVALDRLDDAADRVEQAKKQVEEKARQQQAEKLAAITRLLVERQTRLSADGERLFQAAKSANGWSRTLTKGLLDLGRDQEQLSHETEKLAAEHLSANRILKFMADQATHAMAESSAAVTKAKQNGLAQDSIESDRNSVRRPQDFALKRLRQLAALTEKAKEPREPQEKQPEQKEKDPVDTPDRPSNEEQLPPQAELRALRELQVELNERTTAFAKQHPDADKWTEAERTELASLRKAQIELAELLGQITPAPAGEKK